MIFRRFFPSTPSALFPISCSVVGSSSVLFIQQFKFLNRQSSSPIAVSTKRFCASSSSSASSSSISDSESLSENNTKIMTSTPPTQQDPRRSPNMRMRQHTPGFGPTLASALANNAGGGAAFSLNGNGGGAEDSSPNGTTPPRTSAASNQNQHQNQHQQNQTNAVPHPARTKFLLVVGGVCSSLGKGVTTSTIGALLRGAGFRVSSIKIDPYINVDAGLMSPLEHGEVFVLNDGGEADLDLGNYERWIGLKLGRDHNVTTGKMYQKIISKERAGGYLGKTVQVVPHFTNEVQQHILRVSQIPTDDSQQRPDICLIELGGTVGDIESAPFIEALRQLRYSLPPEDFLVGLVTYLPFMGGGQKTKPTQHCAKTLMSLGIIADFLFCRASNEIEQEAKKKLAQLVGIKDKYIFSTHNVSNLYEIPLLFHEQHVVEAILHKFELAPKRYDTPAGPNKASLIEQSFPAAPPFLAATATTTVESSLLAPALVDRAFPTVQQWSEFAQRAKNPTKTVNIAFVGKYVVGGTDAYFSVYQTFEHCGIQLQVKVDCTMIDPETLEAKSTDAHSMKIKKFMTTVDGIFVPGGFGLRGFPGKADAAKIALEHKIPFFGVCYGFQAALVHIAKSRLGIADADSEETDVNKVSKNHILRYMPEIDRATMGANMRLGGKEVYITAPPPLADAAAQQKLESQFPSLNQPSWVSKMYGGVNCVIERHRHRYEFNRKYLEQFQGVGVRFSGASDPTYSSEVRVEAMELPVEDHPYFVATQYHPEFISNVFDPSPPFLSFVAAVAKMPMPESLNKPSSRAVRQPSAPPSPNNSRQGSTSQM